MSNNLPALGARQWFIFSAFLTLLLMGAGCDIFGGVGGVVAQAIPRKMLAQYKGLAGQRVAVMVWAEPGLRADYPYLQSDVSAGFQDKMKTIQKIEKPDELLNTQFPFPTQTIVKYQEDHPEAEAMPVTDTAAQFNVDRLIYIEITDFSTRSEASLELFKGTLTGSVKVVEVKDGKAKVAYTEEGIKISFPHDSPKEGMPLGSDAKIYQGTLDAFTTELTNRFYTHEEQDSGPSDASNISHLNG